MNNKADYIVKLWLFIAALLVLMMVAIGGFTRLSNAGLSVVEWKPITGALPPLTTESWQEEFSKYQTFPEFQQINSGMTLEQFQYIYWIEYIHRVAGRITVLFYTLPLLYFITIGVVRKRVMSLIAIAGLFFLQGLVGWLMVKSGLIDVPHVSHFRLTAHLLLAAITYSMILWQLFHYISPPIASGRGDSSGYTAGMVMIALLFIQLMLGGLVAGLNAGLVYNSFPLMGEGLIPPEVTGLSFDMFSDAVYVQFMHRMGGNIVFIACIAFAYYLYSRKSAFVTAFALAFIICIQMCLGIMTLIWYVPLLFALLHQISAIILIGIALWAHYYNRYIL